MHIRFLPLLICLAALSGCSKPELVYTKENGGKTRDINEVKGKASFQMVEQGAIPAEAVALHEQARAKGQKGDYDAALVLLEKAIAVKKDWAYPHYDMAFTFLLKGDAAKALAKYQEVDQLVPDGFFTTKTAIWTLEREKKGEFPAGTYVAYVSLEWAQPEKKAKLLDQLTQRIPTFAPAWKERAYLCEDPKAKLELINKALTLDPDAETYGILMINKATAFQKTGDASSARKILEDLTTGESSTATTKTLAREVLKTMKK
jgi:tetratricopeptide (TPR) repeat protein